MICPSGTLPLKLPAGRKALDDLGNGKILESDVLLPHVIQLAHSVAQVFNELSNLGKG